ncbi:FadR/GntR family transcriptional regulator [Noviherbaspirillum sedimenti]|uniref:FadR family transcriptional regulator n=1 Tax=Noviherbaspirillum sedimenti TaxID=2320865 RepID=A0A3A3G2A7_9BURK|nr:GntR family transcriptional regulator [Noviherbaspirillum sedimenti]RJG00612.1 FadR family transcriptional regulator [Noviherbaspirillum sedimenti]
MNSTPLNDEAADKDVGRSTDQAPIWNSIASEILDSLVNSETSAVQVPKLSHVLAERLRGQIISGKLRVGQNLPAESELLNVFKVSRPTLREALRILEAEGLVSVGRGTRSGAEIRMPTVERATQYAAMVLASGGATMLEIHLARMLLEPPLTMLLVGEENRSVVDQLRECVSRQEQALHKKKYQDALALINRFHEVLICGSGNMVLTLLVGMLHLLSQSTSSFLVEGSTDEKANLHSNMAKTISAYKRLVDLLEAGDGAAAEKFWSNYMQRALTFLERTGLGAQRLRYQSVGS